MSDKEAELAVISELHSKQDGDDIESGAIAVQQQEEVESYMKDFESVMDIFQAAIIPDDIFAVSVALVLLQVLLLVICLVYTEKSAMEVDRLAIIIVCMYAATTAVTEIFDDLRTILIGLRAVVISYNENNSTGGTVNRRRVFLGALQFANVSVLAAVMTLIVPLQGSPVDIILNSTAFCAIMQIDRQVLKYMGYTYVFDRDILAYTKKVEDVWMSRQKKLLLILIFSMFGFMNVIANEALKTADP